MLGSDTSNISKSTVFWVIVGATSLEPADTSLEDVGVDVGVVNGVPGARDEGVATLDFVGVVSLAEVGVPALKDVDDAFAVVALLLVSTGVVAAALPGAGESARR